MILKTEREIREWLEGEPNPRPRGFRDQFIECTAKGLTGKTDFISFEANPGMLPAFPTPEMAEQIRTGEWTGVDLIVCGKFGGRCSSGNPGCRQLRGTPAPLNPTG